MEDLLAVAEGIGFNIARAKKIAANIRECVCEMLGEHLRSDKKWGAPDDS